MFFNCIFQMLSDLTLSRASCFLSQSLQVLGSAKFHLLAFNVVQGNQLIVRGEPEELVLSIFETLKVFKNVGSETRIHN